LPINTQPANTQPDTPVTVLMDGVRMNIQLGTVINVAPNLTLVVNNAQLFIN
jgi:hypothetical protein